MIRLLRNSILQLLRGDFFNSIRRPCGLLDRLRPYCGDRWRHDRFGVEVKIHRRDGLAVLPAVPADRSWQGETMSLLGQTRPAHACEPHVCSSAESGSPGT